MVRCIRQLQWTPPADAVLEHCIGYWSSSFRATVDRDKKIRSDDRQHKRFLPGSPHLRGDGVAPQRRPNGSQKIATMCRSLLVLCSLRTARTVENRTDIPTELLRLLEAWPAVQAAQREMGKQGRYVVIEAGRRGLGNRMGPIAGGLALAVTTGRALAVHWPRSDCHRKKNDCDPTSIDDLFEAPTGVNWKGTGCKGPFLIKGDDIKPVDQLKRSKGLGGARGSQNNVCVDTDRCFAWGVSCNQEVKHLFPSPWITYGLFVDYLFRHPTHPVQSRIQKALDVSATKYKRTRLSCGLGVHLRKENHWEHFESRLFNASNPLKDYDVVTSFRNISSKSDDSSLERAVYVAADKQSGPVKKKLVRDLEKAGIPIIDPIAKDPSRMTMAGMYDAAAELIFLSTCEDIVPRGLGHSTFHDVAVARSAYLHGWSQNRIRSFVNFGKPHTNMKHAFVPADCEEAPTK